jgi:hypothetical protein
LALLRDAIVHDLRVTADYFELVTPNQNGFVLRVALSKFRLPIDTWLDAQLAVARPASEPASRCDNRPN